MPNRSDDTDEISRTASVGDIRRIEDKLDNLDRKLDSLTEKHNEVNVWRATIDARLVQGVEKMTALERSIEKGIDGCVEKKVLWAYLVGAATAAGGLGAGIMKLLGSK